jgi:hypothetical protein
MKLLLIHPDLSLIRSLVLEFGGNMEISQISCLNLEDVGKTILQNPDIRAVAIKLTHANEKQVFSVISEEFADSILLGITEQKENYATLGYDIICSEYDLSTEVMRALQK